MKAVGISSTEENIAKMKEDRKERNVKISVSLLE